MPTARMSSPDRSRRLRAGGARSGRRPEGSRPDPRRPAEAAGPAAAGPAGPHAAGPQAAGQGWATPYHAPVLAAETVAHLVTSPGSGSGAGPDGVYIDGTLGGGGHAAALLAALGPGARVVGIDRDAEARAEATARIGDPRFTAVAGTFADMEALAASLGIRAGTVAGVLLDLGISSHQVDDAGRGFAFSADGPLDMRMNGGAGETAAELIARLDADGLADVIYAYGEERRSRRVARAILAAERMATTADLAAAVRSAVPARDELKTLARVFQALRIAVNDEIGQIERALPAALRLLAPGGRLAVIAYHSLEDRRAKRFLRHGHFGAEPRKDAFGRVLSPLRAVTRRPVVAGAAETAANPRARSARLRVAERLGDAL